MNKATLENYLKDETGSITLGIQMCGGPYSNVKVKSIGTAHAVLGMHKIPVSAIKAVQEKQQH